MFRKLRRTSQDEYKDKLVDYRQTPDGREIADDVPVSIPLQIRREMSVMEHVRSLIRSEQLRKEAEAQGDESFEEADDFEVGDYDDLVTPYEFERNFEPSNYMPPVPVSSAAPETPSSVSPLPAAVPPEGGEAGMRSHPLMGSPGRKPQDT